jgi:uncharacterized protein
LTPVLLDTGVVVALLDRSERYHSACVDTVQALSRPMVTCEAVIAEACYLLRGVRGARDAILANVAQGIFKIPLQLARVSPQIQKIFHKYQDREVGLADACLIHMATELRCGDILTLDSDFRVYRWGGNKAFKLLVPLR